jgi:hypothetical protein
MNVFFIISNIISLFCERIASIVACLINWPLGAISFGVPYVAGAGFVMGFFSCLIMMEAIEAAVTTMFVLHCVCVFVLILFKVCLSCRESSSHARAASRSL